VASWHWHGVIEEHFHTIKFSNAFDFDPKVQFSKIRVSPITSRSRKFRKIDKIYYYSERLRVFHFLNKISVPTSPKVKEIFGRKLMSKVLKKNGV
jgi:hypothetical protein